MNIFFILLPLSGALVGWLTLHFLLKLLFWPNKQINILGFSIQGFIPAIKAQLPVLISNYLTQQIFSIDTIEAKVTNPVNIQKVMPFIDVHIDHFIRVKLAEKMPVISMFIGEKTIGELKAVFIEELQLLFPELIKQYMHHLKDDFKLAEIIAEKLNELTTASIQSSIKKQFGKQLLGLKIGGLIIGLVIGTIEAVIFYFIH